MVEDQSEEQKRYVCCLSAWGLIRYVLLIAKYVSLTIPFSLIGFYITLGMFSICSFIFSLETITSFVLFMSCSFFIRFGDNKTGTGKPHDWKKTIEKLERILLLKRKNITDIRIFFTILLIAIVLLAIFSPSPTPKLDSQIWTSGSMSYNQAKLSVNITLLSVDFDREHPFAIKCDIRVPEFNGSEIDFEVKTQIFYLTYYNYLNETDFGGFQTYTGSMSYGITGSRREARPLDQYLLILSFNNLKSINVTSESEIFTQRTIFDTDWQMNFINENMYYNNTLDSFNIGLRIHRGLLNLATKLSIPLLILTLLSSFIIIYSPLEKLGSNNQPRNFSKKAQDIRSGASKWIMAFAAGDLLLSTQIGMNNFEGWLSIFTFVLASLFFLFSTEQGETLGALIIHEIGHLAAWITLVMVVLIFYITINGFIELSIGLLIIIVFLLYVAFFLIALIDLIRHIFKFIFEKEDD
ncbi:MAG: hypothetical protein ACFFC7_29390 [Candidatus Hermodarchaeota archaeon]